jgi:hypothetical protein
MSAFQESIPIYGTVFIFCGERKFLVEEVAFDNFEKGTATIQLSSGENPPSGIITFNCFLAGERLVTKCEKLKSRGDYNVAKIEFETK